MKEEASDEPKAKGEEDEHKNSKDIEEMETDALKKGKEDKNEQEAGEKDGKRGRTRASKRKAAAEEEPAASEKSKDPPVPVADKTSSENPKPESNSKESTKAKSTVEILPPSKPAALPLTPLRKQAKRSEPEGPLLSIEEQKLMDSDVLTLLKRFAPKYYVPLPKIWAIPKSQLTTTPK